MIKNVLIILAISTLLFACGTGTKKDNTDNETVQLTVNELLADIENLVEKKVEITGLVSHVCEHGGKKLKLISENSENDIHVNAGKEITEFNKNIEGSTIIVTGIVKELKIDNEYLDKIVAKMGEKEHAEGEEHSRDEEKNIQESDADHHPTEMDHINKLREEIKNSEKGYLSEYFVLCNNYKVLEQETEGTKKDSL